MTPIDLLLVAMLTGFFVALAAWVRHEWPRSNPFWDRMAHPVERRHFREDER
jgi:hypothetical protein